MSESNVSINEESLYFGIKELVKNIVREGCAEMLNREICCRTRVVGAFSDGKLTLVLVKAALRVSGSAGAIWMY